MIVENYPLVISEKSQQLINENIYFHNTGGTSEGNRKYNFVPAFLDFESGEVFISSFSNGQPAAVHVFDGLPSHLIVRRNEFDTPIRIKKSVVSGFIFENRFVTREQAMNITENIEQGNIQMEMC